MAVGLRIKDRPEYGTKGRALTFTAQATVLEAAQAMSAKNYGSCVVIDDQGKPLGIMTERDLMRKVVAGNLNPEKTLVTDVMTTELRVAKPEDRVVDWLRQMSNERFRRVPVVDENGVLVNVVTQGDFVSYTWPELYAGPNFRQYFLVGGVLVYSLIMALVLKFAV